MSTNQMALPDGESEIITQAEAGRLMGVTRAVLRGYLDRGELQAVDELGNKGSRRVARADVLSLMTQRGISVAGERVAAGDDGCRGCRVLQRDLEAERAESQRLRVALAQAKRMVDTVFSS
ncbi:hypothetical protein ACFRFJ_15805 [Streptomyces hydrogenans]|uniref:hypothetical protein n=1 Tax=Streptomyces hydrogenans TaxID=1873719 RepID=UPI00368318F2